ncbi:putative RNA recognition motif domain, nucleotide-binding alpha-beta plait domain superfamily [Helianthus annuus]|nr:putative RNA recognition motif domain, nucleotide-binding alpha-beta plait domain superfamily [Helianthus annuus]KAJ0646939.1 putative RNA recognition motif domain, nucleotide-binding alpha-beta plait domain superfamily [Helianthus annuus]
MGNPNRRGDHRQPPNPHRDYDDPSSRTTFYITNISDRVTGLKLREVFRTFVNVTDAWVPRRRSVKGRVFGFVRCEKLSDPYAVLPSLNDIVIMESKISVSLSMFDRFHKKISYDDIRVAQKAWVPKEKHVSKEEFPSMLTVYGRASSSRKVLQLDDDGALYPLHSVGRAVVGVSDCIASLRTVKKMLFKVGFDEAAVSYLGGLTVLVTFRDADQMKVFLEDKKEVWKETFVSVSPWSGQNIPFERIVVLKIVGVPVLVREGSVYDKIGSLFGMVVWPSDFSWVGTDNAIGYAHVLTDISSKIDEEVSVIWSNEGYNVWVVEENSGWIPEFESVLVDERYDDFEEGEIRDPVTDAPAGVVNRESTQLEMPVNQPLTADDVPENLHDSYELPNLDKSDLGAQNLNVGSDVLMGREGVVDILLGQQDEHGSSAG